MHSVPTWCPLALLFALSTPPALGQQPVPRSDQPVRYVACTYHYGYDPGYYGSAVAPRDPGAKPGQQIVSSNRLYRYAVRSGNGPARR